MPSDKDRLSNGTFVSKKKKAAIQKRIATMNAAKSQARKSQSPVCLPLPPTPEVSHRFRLIWIGSTGKVFDEISLGNGLSGCNTYVKSKKRV